MRGQSAETKQPGEVEYWLPVKNTLLAQEEMGHAHGASPKPSASFTASERQERNAGRLVEPYAAASSGPGCRSIRVQSLRV